MKRREAKFVPASPRLSPSHVEAVPRPHETAVRPQGKGARGKLPRGALKVFPRS